MSIALFIFVNATFAREEIVQKSIFSKSCTYREDKSAEETISHRITTGELYRNNHRRTIKLSLSLCVSRVSARPFAFTWMTVNLRKRRRRFRFDPSLGLSLRLS